MVTAGAVAATAASVPWIPAGARRGPALASGLAGAITVLVLLWVAMPAVGAPIRAARPYWNTDLATYPDRVAAAAEGAGWQLPVAALLLTLTAGLLLPWVYRIDAIVVGGALTVLIAPAALGLNWVLTPAVAVAAAIVAGVAAQRVGDLRRRAEPPDLTQPVPPLIDPLRADPISIDPTRPGQPGGGFGQPRPTTNLAGDRYGATAEDLEPTVRIGVDLPGRGAAGGRVGGGREPHPTGGDRAHPGRDHRRRVRRGVRAAGGPHRSAR